MKKHFLTVVYAIDDKPETVKAILAQRPWQAVAHTDALKDLEHAQADLTETMDGYDAAWMDVASLKKTLETYKQSGMDFAARVHALERTADKLREENAALQQRDDDWHKEHSNALVEMAKRTHAMDAKNLGLLHALTAEQDENHALHQQLAAIGAGGVEPLRKRECLHQICETAAPASDGAYPKLHERAAFEEWIKKDGGDLRMFGSGQNSHYCNSAVNNAWGGWKASAARVAAKASAPMVLPEPVATLHCNDECYVWARASDAGKRMRFEQALALYTEQQVRAMLATVGQALEASPIDADAQRYAERYRWLRNEETGWYVGPSYSTYNDNVCDGEYHNFFGVELDKAIDAAHAAQGGV